MLFNTKFSGSSVLIIVLLFLIFSTLGCQPPDSGPAPTAGPTEVPTAEPTPAIITGSLRITEVGNTYYDTNFGASSAWIEVYNPSADVVDLSQFMLRSHYITRGTSNYYNTSTTLFSLPALSIQPGAYAIIKGKTYDNFVNGTRIAYVYNSSNNSIPFWDASGFAEIVSVNNDTYDFVRFGSDSTEPLSSGNWNGGDAPALPYTANAYGQSIARNGLNADNNAGTDWALNSFATPGGPNDVTTTLDTDGDGIPDANEADSSSTFAGLPLYNWGARSNKTDIFIHIDYMNSTDPGVIPQRAALDKVVAAFAPHNIAVHFDVGDLYGSAVADYNLDGGSHRVPLSWPVTVPTNMARIPDNQNVYYYKNMYMPLAKRYIFHYLLFAYSQNGDGSGGSSGIAEVLGNDFTVTLGNWGLLTTPQEKLNQLVNYQAGTIMHELGHNLGLLHGGTDGVNYKPNYFSIMNYMYQLEGLPTIGNVREGDRYYWYRYAEQKEAKFAQYFSTGEADLYHGPLTTLFSMDYSDGSGGSISESNISEPLGLMRPVSAGVDYNGNGYRTDTGVSMDLNPPDGTLTTYSDYNDWGNIKIFFARYFWGDNTGVALQDSVSLFPDPVGDDHQQVIFETLTAPKR